MMKEISSLQNPIIKNVLKLQEKSRERKKQNLFIIEGRRELSLAFAANYTFEHIVFCDEIVSENELQQFTKKGIEFIKISKEVDQKIAYRKSTEGILAITKTKDFSLNNISLKKENPIVLVMESTEKPGNIGAMLRSADAANVDAVFIANPKSDLYNPNIIRSSVGCIFTNQIAIGSSEEIKEYLLQHQFHIYSATLQNSNSYHLKDYTKKTALVVGTEATGLTSIWRESDTQNINIPMQGKIDSMNVSVAAAILLFEAKRQRNFK